MFNSKFRALITVLVFGVLVTGCTGSWPWSRNSIQPSVLVILVENLGFGSFSCGEDGDEAGSSGLHAFCQDSVRFTHAYSPSILSAPTVASVLTGLYPIDHGVRHHGGDGLPAKFDTVAEAALQKGYRTSFYLGGPPLWRRAAVHQGFEVFDDNYQVGLNRLYRPALDIFNLFLSWQESEAPRGKFLSFLFLADLQFIDSPTVNDLGEVRDNSYRSQVEEVDESLGALVREMKRRKIWDSTDIFLIGLSGAPQEPRLGEPPGVNLLSEATRATLMVKPARKKRESSFNWKIDENVSLVDVGETLFRRLLPAPLKNVEPNPNVKSRFEVVSLSSALESPQPNWDADRPIISESAWPQWRRAGGIRSAVRQGPYLFLFEEPAQIFNTLSDNMETAPLPNADASAIELRLRMTEYMTKNGYEPWRLEDQSVLAKADLARELWRNREPKPDEWTLLGKRLKDLSRRYPNDEELLGWRAIWALRRGDWPELKEAAGKSNVRPIWAYVAARNLGEKVDPPEDPCFAFLKKDSNWLMPKECVAEGVHDLLLWADEKQPERVRSRAMESFLREATQRALASRIAEANQVTGLQWDVSQKVLHAPQLISLLLALPEMKKYRSIVRARIAGESTRVN